MSSLGYGQPLDAVVGSEQGAGVVRDGGGAWVATVMQGVVAPGSSATLLVGTLAASGLGAPLHVTEDASHLPFPLHTDEWPDLTPACCSVVAVLERRDYTGFETVFPGAGFYVDLQAGDAVAFDPLALHGNAPFGKLSDAWVRRTVVCCFPRRPVA